MDDQTLPPALTSDAFDRTNEAAIINLVPNGTCAALLEAQKKEPRLFDLDEEELYKLLRIEGRGPTASDNRLRLTFWLEVERARAEGTRVQMNRVYAGVCDGGYFFGKFLKSPSRVAWLLTPVQSYERRLEEGLEYGITKLRAILDQDAGKNVKLMELQAKIVMMFDMRLKGGHTQRMESKTLNINVSDKKAIEAAENLSIESLERKIKEIRSRDRQALPVKEIVDVPSE